MPDESLWTVPGRLRGVSKRFAAAWALNQVDLDLRAGEIHALCGENGAGKSTLIQILGGVFRPDAGQIEIDGKPVQFRDPAAALAEGIGIIYQELNLVEPFTVAENLALGHEPRRSARGSIGAASNAGRDRLARRTCGFDLDPRDPVADLTIGQRQQVEIAKALGRRVRILDPRRADRGALSAPRPTGSSRCFATCAARGLAILYVSHHLEEVFAIADRITVLRDGRRVGTWETVELTLPDVVAHMVGEAVDVRRERSPGRSPPPRCSASPARPDGRFAAWISRFAPARSWA